MRVDQNVVLRDIGQKRRDVADAAHVGREVVDLVDALRGRKAVLPDAQIVARQFNWGWEPPPPQGWYPLRAYVCPRLRFHFQQSATCPNGPSPTKVSIDNAYLFLDQMMDAYVQGSTVRLCQSYCDQIAGGTFFSTAFVYDNALLVLAYLARSKSGDLDRARIIGDALLYAQANDPAADGRFRQAYFAGVADNNGVYVTTGLPFFQGSAVGDVAWPGIALAQLYRRTRIQKYLDGAVWAANFIENTTRDNVNVPPGGYYFGNGQSNKSTEHNIDVFALFTMLAQLTGNSSWLNGALHAQQFVLAMWDAPSGHFWTGTSDPTHIFFNNSPEDVNSWSYLAMQDPNFAVSLDWNKTNLLTTDTTFAFNNGWGVFGSLRLRVTGMTFASLSKLGTVLGDGSVNADAVWIEGTGHLIGALTPSPFAGEQGHSQLPR